MNKILKTSLMGVGGLGLFAATYVGIALISGAPLHKVAGISMFVDAPEETEGPGLSTRETSDAEPEDEKTGAELLTANAGLLGAFQMAAPFSPSELRALENELKSKLRTQTTERMALEVRSLELDEWENSIRENQAKLATFRTKLEDLEGKIDLRMAELERDEGIAKDRERQSWRKLAEIYKGGEVESNSKMIQEESPEDAALILRELESSEVGDILRLIQPPSERKKYMDAYRLASTAAAD